MTTSTPSARTTGKTIAGYERAANAAGRPVAALALSVLAGAWAFAIDAEDVAAVEAMVESAATGNTSADLTTAELGRICWHVGNILRGYAQAVIPVLRETPACPLP